MADESDMTVLDDNPYSDGPTHQEIATELLPQLKEEMPEDEYRSEFTRDLQSAVIQAITQDLSSNLEYEDWRAMGFEEPADFLDAEEVSSAIGNTAEWYLKDDQIGKSWDILQVIFEYAEEYDLVERQSQRGE